MIKIGKYLIKHTHNEYNGDLLWMVKDDGEGMEYDIEKFEKFLDEFWAKEF